MHERELTTRTEHEAELPQLYAVLTKLHGEAGAILRAISPGHYLNGEARKRFLAKEKQMSEVLRKISLIQGD